MAVFEILLITIAFLIFRIQQQLKDIHMFNYMLRIIHSTTTTHNITTTTTTSAPAA